MARCSDRLRSGDAWRDHEFLFCGRAEVHIRRTVEPAIYADFASIYPTVCTLMGLWWFVIANGVDQEDATAETQSIGSPRPVPSSAFLCASAPAGRGANRLK